jgi:NAD(P)H-hydrate repair Nnr-like enzyme with NAD(P)H-hydrate dehydratase domain
MKFDPFTAACAAAYINGSAGDLAAREKGPGMMASDLLDKIPLIIK